jgi:hypothetical protein
MEDVDERNRRIEKTQEAIRKFKENPESLRQYMQPQKYGAEIGTRTHCRDCGIHGVNLPNNHLCGNCGSRNTFQAAPQPSAGGQAK